MVFPYNIHICSSSLSENFWQLIFSSLPLCIFKRTLGGLRFPSEVQTSGQGQNSEGWSNRGKTWKKGRLEWERTLLLSVHFTHSPPHFTHRCRVTTSPCWSYKTPCCSPHRLVCSRPCATDLHYVIGWIFSSRRSAEHRELITGAWVLDAGISKYVGGFDAEQTTLEMLTGFICI